MVWGLPKILTEEVHVGGETWQIHYYEEFKEIASPVNTQAGFAMTAHKPFLERYTVQGVPLLFGFFPETKQIRVATPNAARELFLLQEIEKDPKALQIITGESEANARYQALKEHIHPFLALNPKQFPSMWERVTKTYQLPNLQNQNEWTAVYKEAERIETVLVPHLRCYRQSVLEKFSDFSLSLVAEHPVLRVHLLQLIAALPSLDHDRRGTEVKRLTLETLRRLVWSFPRSLSLHIVSRERESYAPHWIPAFAGMTKCLLAPLPAQVAAIIIRSSVRFFARRFIAGESIEKAAKALTQLKKTGRDATLDPLGELVVSNPEADHYCEEILKLIRGFSHHIPKGERNAAGILRAHVSIKLSALAAEFKPQAPEYTYEQVAPRLKKILRTAEQEQVFINVDAEYYAYRDLSLYLFRRTLLETPELKNFGDVGIVLQAYLRDAYPHFLDILELAKTRGLTIPVRLVKGAYWDTETIEANAYNFNAPEFLNKEETDLHFRQLIIKTLEQYPQVQLCVGSHNLADHCFAAALRKLHFPHTPPIQHECLHMTYEALSSGMAKVGWVVRNYVPIGNLLVGMSYLVRRIMENASQVGVLTMMRNHHQKARMTPKKEWSWDRATTVLSPEFRNTTPLRLYLEEEKKPMVEAMEKVGRAVPKTPFTTKEETLRAIGTAEQEMQSGGWAKLPAVLRAGYLLKAASLLLVHRTELAAIMVHEGKKAPAEALADVDEAIDFLNFYSRIAVEYSQQHQVRPRGIVGVIAPWNFPLAIPCGMSVAPLAAGNTVLLKPAERTRSITQRFTELLYEAGVPPTVFQHLPGRGREVGVTLVQDPRVTGIVFTGSKEVGLWIAEEMRKKSCQPPPKVITEMGGKNAIIITNNAELDETITGVLYSCFGHAGQKCSAASRLIVDEAILDRFLGRFKAACEALHINVANQFAATVNPVIAVEEKERLLNAVAEVRQEVAQHGGKIVIDRTQEVLPDTCLGPLVVVLPKDRALQSDSFACQELFGPIVHVIPYRTREEAIEIANATEYALTGGIFSQSQDDIDFLSTRLEVGNIYINRHITGARVSIEPFGGFKNSGTGPKAGSRQYLEAFYTMPTSPFPLLTKEGASFSNFLKWLEENGETFRTKIHPNRSIPGQESFDNYNFIKEKGIVVADIAPPSEQILYHFFAAHAVGAEINVITRTEEAHQSWKRLCQGMQKVTVTFGKNHLAMGHQAKAQFAILDSRPEQIQNVAAQLPPLCSVHTHSDGPTPPHWEEYLYQFVLPRSFAINTMRYGAPLTLGNPKS